MSAETQTQSPSAIATRNARIRSHLELARRIARSVGRRIPSSFPREDLEGAAFLGLTEAACRFDARQSEAFGAYAAKCIRGAILDELRRRDVMPRRSREKAKRLQRATLQAEALHGGPATSEQIAEVLGVTVEELYEEQVRFRVPTMKALDEASNLPGTDTFVDIESAIENHQRAEALHQVVAKMPARDRAILHMYYAESRNLKEIGAALGISESRVCQLRTRAEKNLRQLVAA